MKFPLVLRNYFYLLSFFFLRYYDIGEIREFEGYECEWPLFFILMIIDGVFKNNSEQIEEYQIELRKCLHTDAYGDPVVTMYFAPDGQGSYLKAPSQSLFLWGQSLFIIAQLLTAGLLHVNELDPIRRYLPSYNRPRRGGRYSAFQVGNIQFFNYLTISISI